ncbi:MULTISPECIES: protease modulator HflC [Methylovorus]|jgi:modulator of FtsH protease HflC|uniref:Protein HflC n=1 Tax=Methylovorus glucosotrophus (strain SIP3-4) TaxID=582744 RepID=C6XEF9_METGS|nr:MULTISPECIES: protease modulator HflC [Methylovorus]ACT50934.1 HflC protein [Methylovorus glucosotrophus SIP3-4]ADQ84843.1 HflC protein [Methylovorus sp. MP688]KAF0843751.1 protease FtsH subunit HflC [Methylovorus glucosotrophus]
MKNLSTVLIGLIAALLLISLSAFTVDQREYALVFRLGEIVSVKKEPGLYFKMPFVENVRYFDKRILTLNWVEPDRFLTSEKKNVLVDSFVKWRIVDPAKYYVSVKGDELQAERRLSQTVNDGLRAEFGKRTIHDVVSGERGQIMEILRQRADRDAKEYGIQVLDVRLRRVDLPQEVSESVYQRMEAERKRVANELRSQGAGAAEKIRADADRQREVIIAEAFREAQRIKGEGDAKASEIYSQAYGKNPEFYAFYRSLDAYRNSFKSKNDVMVLEPDSDFFKYLRSPSPRK